MTTQNDDYEPPGDHDPTPPLDLFLAAYQEGDNEWRIAGGHHQNLFDEAIERLQAATALREMASFVREFYAVGGNGEGWTFEHLDAIAAVALGQSDSRQRTLAQGVMGVEWVRKMEAANG